MRLHFFSDIITKEDFSENIRELVKIPVRDSYETENTFFKNLRSKYLGYTIIRPVEDALIGRTMIIPHSDENTWLINAKFNQEVHFLGLVLGVNAFPFQQQDRRAGACATTAIWSVLTKVARKDGNRPPGPGEITRAAINHFIPTGIPLPPSLFDEQICEAIRRFDYTPYYLDPDDCRDHVLFKAIFASFLASDIPVIMTLSDPENREDGHAIACCGYDLDEQNNDLFENRIKCDLIRWERIFFHDDRLGPYAEGFVSSLSDKSLGKLMIPWRDRQNAKGEIFKEYFNIDSIIVPLYPKLRITVESLAEFGTAWIDHFSQVLSDSYSNSLSLEFYFKRSGDIMRDIIGFNEIYNHKYQYLNSLVLSRYVGVVNIKVADEMFIQFLLDTTDFLEKPVIIDGYRDCSDSNKVPEESQASRYQEQSVPTSKFSQVLGVILNRKFSDVNEFKALTRLFEVTKVPLAYD